MQKQFDECYAIDEDDQALACLKNLVRTATGDCRPRLVLLTQDNCIPCRDERAFRRTDIDSGIIQEINIKSTEGLAITKKNDIVQIPALLFLDCKNNLIYPSV